MPSKFIIVWKGAKFNPVLKSYHLPRALSNPSSKVKKNYPNKFLYLSRNCLYFGMDAD